MATKLQKLLQPVPRALEPQDVFAAFQRAARQRWGERVPLEPVRVVRGVLTVTCPSPLWRTELLFTAHAVLTGLHHELPGSPVRRISAVLA